MRKIIVLFGLLFATSLYFTGCTFIMDGDVDELGGDESEPLQVTPPPVAEPDPSGLPGEDIGTLTPPSTKPASQPMGQDITEMAPIPLELPRPMFKGTPTPAKIGRAPSSTASRSRSSKRSRSANRELELAYGSPDEVWIVEKFTKENAKPAAKRARADLVAKDPVTQKLIPIPLQHTKVDADISMFVAKVGVVQQYANPFDAKIEATYIFPLPQNAAVTDFLMKIGERTIRGLIREKEEAKKIYEEAKRQGYVASLLTQERPNIFVQKVANIEPGKRIDIEMTYFNTLKYVKGEYEFVFPMVVGPRFNPPDYKGGIGAVARGNAAKSVHDVSVQYLAPNERSGHDIGLTVNLDSGVAVENLYSPSHAVKTRKTDAARVQVALKENDRIPNRDFVLRYRLAGKKLKSAMMYNRGDRENTFALLIEPPESEKYLERQPREMIFVVDCSGSMGGKPLNKAKEAMRRCLRHLDAKDTFQVIRFSSNASQLGPGPIPASPENVRRGLDYIDKLNSGGGTMMIEGIKAALDMPHEAHRMRIVSFMTDGYIGNEDEILAAIKQRLRKARIFSFGVGNSVNRYLIESMARVGKGAAAYVGLDEGSGTAVDRFYERAAYPALTDISINWGGMKVSDLYPKQIPDLFPGKPIMLSGKFKGQNETVVTINGELGGEKQSYSLRVNTSSEEAHHEGIQFVWARNRIREMYTAHIMNPADELKDELVRFSTEYSVLCNYTAFLALDSSRKTAGSHGYSVHVPVPVPDGVLYETTVK